MFFNTTKFVSIIINFGFWEELPLFFHLNLINHCEVSRLFIMVGESAQLNNNKFFFRFSFHFAVLYVFMFQQTAKGE